MNGIPVFLTLEDAPIVNPIILTGPKKIRKPQYIKKTNRCFSKDAVVRFKDLLSRSVYVSKTGCMEWTGTINKNGYGYASIFRKVASVPRHVYLLFFGEIPNGMFVCHKCDNRKCINPGHLFLGSPQENVNDCVSKGRHARGFMLPNTIFNRSLTDKAIGMIESGMTYKEIAKVFNVHNGTINTIALKNGFRQRIHLEKNHERDELVIKLAKEGICYKQISKQLGLNYGWVKRFAIRKGVRRRSLGEGRRWTLLQHQEVK